MDTLDHTAKPLQHAADRLATEFDGIASRQTVVAVLEDATLQLGEARINTFVPILAERIARNRLRLESRRPVRRDDAR